MRFVCRGFVDEGCSRLFLLVVSPDSTAHLKAYSVCSVYTYHFRNAHNTTRTSSHQPGTVVKLLVVLHLELETKDKKRIKQINNE